MLEDICFLVNESANSNTRSDRNKWLGKRKFKHIWLTWVIILLWIKHNPTLKIGWINQMCPEYATITQIYMSVSVSLDKNIIIGLGPLLFLAGYNFWQWKDGYNWAKWSVGWIRAWVHEPLNQLKWFHMHWRLLDSGICSHCSIVERL